MTGPVYGRVTIESPLRVVNDGLILCKSQQALKGKRGGQSTLVAISNDSGRTVSNSIEITFRTNLPRLLAMTEPAIIFADNQRVDLSFRGTNLYSGIMLILTET